jgi:hypothetical protein
MMQGHARRVRKESNRSFHVVDDRIAYKYFDTVSTGTTYGFETAFLAMKECEKGNISRTSMESYVQLNVRVSTTSHAEFPFEYDCILGITGTLRALMPQERAVLVEVYGIQTFSYIPSVFGCNRLVFAGDSERGKLPCVTPCLFNRFCFLCPQSHGRADFFL